jgi:hypothetical protein
VNEKLTALKKNLHMVEALYLHIKNDLHLVYEFERHFDELKSTQFIRIPKMIREENRGTCIDLVLLFLSCVANIYLDPLYVHVRMSNEGKPVDHAMAAVWLSENRRPHFSEPLIPERQFGQLMGDGHILLIDCTGFATGFPSRPYKLSFEEAQQEAKRVLQTATFRFALDVRNAWRNGERPLPYDHIEILFRTLSTLRDEKINGALVNKLCEQYQNCETRYWIIRYREHSQFFVKL